MTEIEEQTRSILDSLIQRPFTDCVAISKSFADLPTSPGIDAVLHRSEGLLYVGKTQDMKEPMLFCVWFWWVWFEKPDRS